MQFTPKSDAELYKMLQEGTYNFEVSQAEDTTSKSSRKEMLKLTLKVFGPDKEHIINDYIVDGAKLKRFCECIGMTDAYNRGDLPAESVIGHGGVCKVGIEQSEQYGDRNRISGYVPQKAPSTSPGVLRTEGVPAQQTKAALQRAAVDTTDTPF